MAQTSYRLPFSGRNPSWVVLERTILRQAERERKFRRMKSSRMRQLIRLRALGYLRY